jgi:phage baseplate assembly protein W
MIGMNARTGLALTDREHIEQSVADILFTPLGTRIMRRDYGSLLPELIDGPVNPAMRLRIMAASVMALARWEPRIRVTQVDIGETQRDGSLVIGLHGERTHDRQSGAPVTLRVTRRSTRGAA